MDLGSASPGDCFSTQYVVYSWHLSLS
jgi:hypothetical protein